MLEIEYLPITALTPYANNAKIHSEEQIQQIVNSIEEFGMNDPIAVWKEGNLIIEGHGRLLACQRLGMETVPVIHLDHLTDEQRKAYTLAHNKLTMNTGFDLEKLNMELSDIDLDMADFGFLETGDIDWADVEDLTDETYEKPEKDMLKCPHCNFVDTASHFKKVGAEDE